jgi:restriction system protein
MSRRRNNPSFMDILILLPWWLTLIAGAGLWCYLKMTPLPTGPAVFPEAIPRLAMAVLQWMCLGAALISGIITLTRKLTFASAKDIDAIKAMSWRQFETLVGEAYRRQGYAVEETGGGGADGGIDLILRGKGLKVIVQCKQWRTYRVGVKIVREMYGVMVAENADRVIIVASGTYTQDAVDFARGKPIELVNGKALAQLIKDVKGEPAAAPIAAPAPVAKVAPQQVLKVQTQAVPACPKCGSTMILRTARKGANAGAQFWGCSKYPACRGVVNAD